MNTEILSIIDRETELLLADRTATPILPSAAKLGEIMDLVWNTIFYDNFHKKEYEAEYIRQALLSIYTQLTYQLELLLDETDPRHHLDARKKMAEFLATLHDIKHKVITDVTAIRRNDPAAVSPQEIIASYPAVKALVYYRVAHSLNTIGVPVLPRMISELAHSMTGIDIHPAASIGEYCAIDHGTGVVIGETAVIGDNVTIYQGVTLGAKSFSYDEEGIPLRTARHPIIEDNVTIYSNASVLGRITIGHDSVIGGNVWITQSLPPFSKITQSSLLAPDSAKS